MPRAILDPNVLVSAAITHDGLPARLLTEFRDGSFELIVSPRLLRELRDVLGRDKFRRYVTVEEAEAFVETLITGATVRPDPHTTNPPLPSDPDDQYLVDLLVATQVDALVTGDAALLDLREILPVMSPAEFMLTLAEV